MKSSGTPQLDARDAEATAADLLARLPGYVPDWKPVEGGPGWALVQAYARYLQALAERLGQAPDKNRLAFLDMLGINLLPAQAARAPLVFKALPHTGDGRVPQRTQVGATVAEREDPLIFETENAIALASAQLAEVITLWPGKDAYADHSTKALGGEPFTLFESLKPVPHELYLAHDAYFALSGQATVELQFELARPGSEPLSIAWEYWDGEVWRGFKAFVEPAEATDGDSLDGTEGLTRSGIVRLVADCAETEKTTVNGLESYWLRGRLTTPLPPRPERGLPMVNRIAVNTVIRQEVWVQRIEQLEVSDPPSVSGTVTDADGNPLPGIDVGLSTFEGDVQVTDENGYYEFPGVASGVTWTVTVYSENTPFFYSELETGDRSIRMDFILHPGLPLDAAYNDGLELDVSKSFYPFGQQPQPGTAFFISSEAVFEKANASVTIYGVQADTAQGEAGDFPQLPRLIAEYWNGRNWQNLGLATSSLNNFFGSSVTTTGLPLKFDVPRDMEPVEVNGKKGRWLRIRVVNKSWIRQREISYIGPDPDGEGEKTFLLTISEIVPPALADFRVGFTYRSPQEPPHACLTYSDFQWTDRSEEARWRGQTFEPFSVVADRTPALYLGFDRPLPADLISLYLDIQEVAGRSGGPALKWEYAASPADLADWRPLTVEDETMDLALPGMVSAVWPGTPPLPAGEAVEAAGPEIQMASTQQAAQFRAGDLLLVGQGEEGELVELSAVNRRTLTLKRPLGEDHTRVMVSRARLPRFGTPRTWIRARLQIDGEPLKCHLNGIHLNAVWSAQIQTLENEVLGGSDGRARQVFFLRQSPVLAGEIVEVRELSGPRAAVELPILQEALTRQGLTGDAIRTVTDPRSGAVSEVWVRWQSRPNLFFSGPDARHYVIERSQGRLIFGDGRNGRIPPAGRDNVLVRRYRSGGGQLGNVPAETITQLLSGVPVESVSNPRAAEGGADGEPVDAVHRRGPQVLRHRYQALSAADYEALAREASPAVAVARALPATHASGRPAPGWVRLIIMPHSQEPRPQPSFTLRRQVQAYLAARVPAGIAAQISVQGPAYLGVGVEAVIAPLDLSQSGPVLQAAATALEAFLHPLTGGPDGLGWPFGRDVYLSDVAAVLEAVEGVDYVETLNLLLDNTPQGETVNVPPQRIVVAGPIELTQAVR